MEIKAKDAEAGVWYQHGKYGKVLCCGRRGLEYYNGFVTLDSGAVVRFLLNDEVVTKSLNQSWDAEPSRPIAGESTAKNVNEAMSLGEKAVSAVQESTGEVPQLISGSSPALTDIGLRVDRHGNVVFRPELVEKTL